MNLDNSEESISKKHFNTSWAHNQYDEDCDVIVSNEGQDEQVEEDQYESIQKQIKQIQEELTSFIVKSQVDNVFIFDKVIISTEIQDQIEKLKIQLQADIPQQKEQILQTLNSLDGEINQLDVKINSLKNVHEDLKFQKIKKQMREKEAAGNQDINKQASKTINIKVNNLVSSQLIKKQEAEKKIIQSIENEIKEHEQECKREQEKIKEIEKEMQNERKTYELFLKQEKQHKKQINKKLLHDEMESRKSQRRELQKYLKKNQQYLH